MNRKRFKIVGIVTVILIIGVCATLFFLSPSLRKLELNGAEKITLMVNSYYEDEGVKSSDVTCEGDVDTSRAGVYEITYKHKWKSATRTVEVLDNKEIIMNLNGAEEAYVLQNQEYIESGCHVIDENEGNLTDKVEIKGQVDTSKTGDYDLVYFVENSRGVECSRKRTVHVVSDFEKNETGIPVLMYHYVYTEEDVPERLNINYILDKDLEAQLKYLIEQNYYFPSYQEISAYIKGEIDLPKKSIVLTFDDGQKGFLKYGIPLLEKYKVPATSFVIASHNGEKKVKEHASEYVSFQSHSYDMHKGGGNIGHGGIISAMSEEEIINDLNMSFETLQNSEAFAYPYGDVTEESKMALESAGVLCAFTTEYGKVRKGDDFRALKRIRVAGDAPFEVFMATIL